MGTIEYKTRIFL